ncbi:hypothetical protein DERF_008496 [Dermatophagoides farinae]|uniref:Uncharacterized protein n=1 Tax=Dermatophagoides farinae TaxID=6954 RepID=A0A922I134_DERFA|nr:hypothetical protein DERF_008496 [Dermatophagoides farinae]
MPRKKFRRSNGSRSNNDSIHTSKSTKSNQSSSSSNQTSCPNTNDQQQIDLDKISLVVRFNISLTIF